MKIRIKEQFIRFRLTKTDVRKLAEDGMVIEHSQFLTRMLIYSIVRTTGHQLSIDFDGKAIIVGMPGQMIDELSTTEIVGFSENSSLMKILVEKDFICLEAPLEDQSDNYDHPNS
ncbi:hypothetical protein GCM10010967_57440 [Dyadobacter beijingensis]|uniref:Uncharacterized protein n=1 Tax=Dyadobacter beijingensis TaxID=365489 RepID=A0ABQ2IMK9_9BACT|nr:hypothetical protein [Dyadobacter beijingensis]GGN13765.1 hypothetical protein GCM10010967_57440 [Dyadobacter beijingensis]